jgi:hypothetical protein
VDVENKSFAEISLLAQVRIEVRQRGQLPGVIPLNFLHAVQLQHFQNLPDALDMNC